MFLVMINVSYYLPVHRAAVWALIGIRTTHENIRSLPFYVSTKWRYHKNRFLSWLHNLVLHTGAVYPWKCFLARTLLKWAVVVTLVMKVCKNCFEQFAYICATEEGVYDFIVNYCKINIHWFKISNYWWSVVKKCTF